MDTAGLQCPELQWFSNTPVFLESDTSYSELTKNKTKQNKYKLTTDTEFLSEGIKTLYEHTWNYVGNKCEVNETHFIFQFFKIGTLTKSIFRVIVFLCCIIIYLSCSYI